MERTARLERLIARASAPKGRTAAAIGAELTRTLGPGALGSTQVLRLKPGRRALLRLHWRKAGGEVPVLAKIRAKAHDHAAVDIQRRLEGLSAEGFPIAALLGEVPSARLWLQTDLGGVGGGAFLADGGDAALFGARSAAAIRRLHESGVRLEREWSVPDEAAVMGKALDRLAAGAPRFAPDARRLLQTALDVLSGLGPFEARAIHRDFYMDQVQVTERGFALVDLDLAAHGDPAQDAGNFLAHLDEWRLREPGLSGALEQAIHAFSAGLPFSRQDRERMARWRAISLTRLAAIGHALPERAAFTAVTIEAAERALGAEAVPAV
ncbi:phosphotransferase [Aureimonas populi]|uniref:Phosphotransferase n=1 Tax=Aureimonas populi TaxID=1701758 RepID=A0ABW5CL41_9HYPH|nr:phosphotransferase [Aureimonas populi]